MKFGVRLLDELGHPLLAELELSGERREFQERRLLFQGERQALGQSVDQRLCCAELVSGLGWGNRHQFTQAV